MSAFLVNDETIAAIVEAAEYQYAPGEIRYYWDGQWRHRTFQWAGEILLAENYRSLTARYGEDHGFEQRAYEHKPPRILAPVAVLKVIRCYEYQACESEDWRQTEAQEICTMAERRAIRKLPGYNEAPWGL